MVDAGGPGWGLRACISNKFLGDAAAAAGLGATLQGSNVWLHSKSRSPYLTPGFLGAFDQKCGPWISNVGLTWKPVRNADSDLLN